MNVARTLLARRRFDASLLAAGFAMMALLATPGKAVFVFFLVAGLYLAATRIRSARHAPKGFSIALAAYAVWSVGLSLLRGEPIAGNRELTYTLIEAAFLVLPLGLCLVARPVDAMVAGARVAILGALLLASVQFALFSQRVGLGSNEAIFGFVIAMAGILSRLRARRPWPLLPDSRAFFYVSFLPVMMSETRAAWFVYPLLALADAVTMLRTRRKALAARPWRLAAIVLLVLALAVPMGKVFLDRLNSGVTEFSNFQQNQGVDGSVNVRLAMWHGASDVLAAHPLIGVGGTKRIEAVAGAPSVSPESGAAIREFKHLHNLFVDQATTSGLVGLALLLVVFGTFLWTVFAWTRDGRTRQTACAMLFLVATFGSFHGILLNEWMIIMIFGSMSVLLTELKKRRFGGPASAGAVEATGRS